VVSPARRRVCVEHVVRELGVSERKACAVLGQHRSTQRYERRVAADESALVGRIEEIVRSHPRYGYRLVCGRLRLDGWRVNHKRVHRLCRREGLRVPRKNRRKRRLGVSANGIERRKAMHRNDVWCWDFVEDSDFLGRPLRFLTLVDEYTRESLLLEAERSMTGERIRDLIAEVFKERGAPRYLRSDNGSEFIATKLRQFLEAAKVETLYIEPGAPWQNGYGESFNGRLRDELLNSRIVRDLRRPPRGEGARGALAARVQPREAAQLARVRCPGPLRGAACRRCARGSAPSLRGGKRGNCAFDENNPTLIVLDQRSGAGQGWCLSRW
jgi:transposase InsO family protein